MGNNQGSVGDGRSRQRRPSTSEPLGPLEVMGTQRYSLPDASLQPGNPQAAFSRHLVEQMNPDPEREFLTKSYHNQDPRRYSTPAAGSAEIYARRYRAGSISIESHTAPLLARENKFPAVIKWEKEAKEVAITGSFNNWERKIPLVKSENNFYTIIEVPEGEHQYRFLVDGQWRYNPSEPSAKNNSGVINNVLKVSRDDFEFLQAVETDREASSKTSGPVDVTKWSATPSDNPNAEYGKHMPTRKQADRLTGPPILPPHLLQVILNKDVSDHLEPGLLPEPNHVMLNHLYALSIKDGVMVLSDTSRYKKKYVTTLLYKPIDS